MFEFHVAFGVTLLALVAAAALIGLASRIELCCRSLVKSIAYLVLILASFNLVAVTYYAVTNPICQRCMMRNEKNGMKDMKHKNDRGMMDNMMTQPLGESDAGYEDRFIAMMIPHHEMAVDMAKDAIEKSNQPALKKMAQEIIAAQNNEIVQMKAWRQQWYGH